MADKGNTNGPPSNSALAVAQADRDSQERIEKLRAARAERQAAMVVSEHGLQLNSFADMLEFGRVAVATKLVPKGLDTPEKVALVVQMGREAGLSTMKALQSIDVIEGQPAWKTKAALAMVRASGKMAGFKATLQGKEDGYGAVAWSKRKDTGEEMTRTFTVGEAKQAKLWGKKSREGKPTPWVLYPQRMLLARAISFLMKDLYGDVLGGWATSEEQFDIATHEAERNVTPIREENEGGDPMFAELAGEEAPARSVMPEVVEQEPDGEDLEEAGRGTDGDLEVEQDVLDAVIEGDTGQMPPVEEESPAEKRRGPGPIELAIQERAAAWYPKQQTRAMNRMRKFVVDKYGTPELPDGDQLLEALDRIRNFNEPIA